MNKCGFSYNLIEYESILSKIFGDPNEKFIKNLQPIIEKINSFEPEFEKFSAEQLKEKTKEFKERLAKGGNTWTIYCQRLLRWFARRQKEL